MVPNRKKQILFGLIAGILRPFFHLLYHHFAWSYDLVANTVSIGRWKKWVQAAALLISGPRVLELGFGPGHLQSHLHKNGLNVFGLDESRQMTSRAHRMLREQQFSPQLSRGFAQRLPFASGSFNSVVATFPTLYIVDPNTLAEIHRVLIPGGRLVVLMAAWLTGASLQERLLQKVFRITGQVPPDDQDINEFLEPYRLAGFRTSLRFVEQKYARLLFIIAIR